MRFVGLCRGSRSLGEGRAIPGSAKGKVVMTVLQIANEHCANWRGDGKGCLGAVIDDDLQIRRCTPRPKCLLGAPGVRCLYFEECVAPMAKSIRNDLVRREFEEVVWRYRVFAKLAP